jgi:hypothetical protein
MRKVTSVLALLAMAVAMGFLLQTIIASMGRGSVATTPTAHLAELNEKKGAAQTGQNDNAEDVQNQLRYEAIAVNAILFLIGTIASTAMLFSERSRWMRYLSIAILGIFLFAYSNLVIFGMHVSFSEWVMTRVEALQVSFRMRFWSLAISEIHRIAAGVIFSISFCWIFVRSLGSSMSPNREH